MLPPILRLLFNYFLTLTKNLTKVDSYQEIPDKKLTYSGQPVKQRLVIVTVDS